MLNNRSLNIGFIALLLLLIIADLAFRFHLRFIYVWLLLIYIVILICGSYFIRMNFFLQSVNYFDTEEKIIALSFDDGPSPNLTPQILDILKTHQVEACFFCIGSRMTGQELLLNRIVKENHIIGNHSYSHSHFFDLFNAKKMLKDIQQMSLACKDMTGRYPVFFRPPYGVTNPNLKKAVEKAGFVSIGWTIRSYDTIINQEEKLLERIVSRIKPGAIILLHDTNETTVRMLPRLIERISEKGFKTKRLDKMIKLEPYA